MASDIEIAVEAALLTVNKQLKQENRAEFKAKSELRQAFAIHQATKLAGKPTDSTSKTLDEKTAALNVATATASKGVETRQSLDQLRQVLREEPDRHDQLAEELQSLLGQ